VGLYIPWVYVCCDSVHIFAGPARTILNHPWICEHTHMSYQIPWLYVQIKCQLACCCHFKQPVRNQEKKVSSCRISYFLYGLHIMCHSSVFTGVAQLKYWQSPFLQCGGNTLTTVGSLASLCHNKPHMMWKNIHCMVGMDTHWLPTVVLRTWCKGFSTRQISSNLL